MSSGMATNFMKARQVSRPGSGAVGTAHGYGPRSQEGGEEDSCPTERQGMNWRQVRSTRKCLSSEPGHAKATFGRLASFASACYKKSELVIPKIHSHG